MIKRILFLFAFLSLAGCASSQVMTKQNEVIGLLQERLVEQSKQLDHLQKDNLRVQAQLKAMQLMQEPSSLPEKAVKAKEKSPALSGEHLLYSNVIAEYRAQRLKPAQRSMQLLLKGYPESVHADNALYLIGDLALKKKKYRRAKEYFDRILIKHPQGNKVVAALAAKARLFEQVNKPVLAKRYWKRVIARFPGSVEAFHAAQALGKTKVIHEVRNL